MGDKDSSSKRKSSKKKSHKISSKVLKKKSRRKESKRRHRPSDSVSSDAKSKSSSSESAYSYERKKAPHRSPIASKSIKKRSLRRNGSPSKNSGSRKRKRSTKDLVVKSRKKSLKKSRKHLSSSSSSDSESGSQYHRKRKIWSPSSSSCSRCDDDVISVDHGSGALAAVDYSRRLKSVISVANQRYDENKIGLEMDPHKEEMVYDHNDYPSPKSFDSNEGICNKRMRVDNTEFEEVVEPVKYGNNDSDRYSAGKSNSAEVPSNNSKEEETCSSVAVVSLDQDKNKNTVGDDDLESILRQKALKNLRRFQVGHRADQKTTSNHIIKSENFYESSNRRIDSIQNKSTNRDISSARETDQISNPELKKDFSHGAVAEKDSDGEHAVKESGIPEHAFLDFEEKEKLVAAKPVSTNDSIQGTTEKIPCVLSPSGEPSLKVQKNEANDGSEFEQKTMSVMRGGEMVQVSYKVYIPKRASALARRQLRR